MDTSDFTFLVGCLTLGVLSYKLLCFLWTLFRCYILTSFGFVKNLKEYGEWVVVTGASDGIGKEYAKQLASRGFHIVLISRTLSKLENVAKEIEEKYNVKTKIICFDFSEPCGYEKIENEIADLDVGILVNNVGWAFMYMEPFIERPIDKITNMIHTNTFSFVNMTHMVLKGMHKRKRGAIINICAGAIYIDGFLPNYAATKTFMVKLFKSLQAEYSEIIDQQIVVPFGVSTNLMTDKPGGSVVSAEDYVKQAILTIGVTSYTHGCPTHEFMGFFFKSIPKFIMTILVKKVLIPMFREKSDKVS